MEIAKLRLWLSLIVDEEDINKIKPLPNLDYKIMQGNSLISEFMGIDLDNDKQNNENAILFSADESKELHETLKAKKDELLNQPNTNKKKILRKEIEDLIINIFEIKLQKQKSDYFKKVREIEEKWERHPVKEDREREIKIEKDMLSRKTGFNLEEAEKQLRQYTSNQKIRPFFPWKLYFSEVFQEKDGFDVVIGNPPYISAVSMARSDEEKKYYKKKYPEATGSYDIFVLFLLKTIGLTNSNGSYCWIIPNKFLIADYAFLTKKKLLNNGLILSIDVSTFEVFKNTSVYPIIIIGNKNKNNHKAFHELLLDNYMDLEIRKFKIPFILKEHKTFADFKIKFCSGATGFEAGILKKFISEKKKKGAIPFVVSGGIDKYSFSNTNIRFMRLKFSEAYIEFSNNIAKSKWNFWMNSKVVIAGMTKEIESVFVKDCLALGVGVYAIYDWGKFNPKYLSGVLNSKYLSFYVKIKFKDKHLAGGYLAINKSTLEKLPLVFSEEQEKIAVIVDYIQFLKNRNNSKVIFLSLFELLIDAIVYELYFPEEIKSADCGILKHLSNLLELKEDWSDEKKLQNIEEIYKLLSNPIHPVTIAMEKQKTVSEVRIIEGLPALSVIEGDK